ncbi:hypothetical protein GCM10010464_13780 [Pseudonocardia yunnanensis]|uniref:DUF308 domain-containing protein n=1 Tax=Pseudonocardia yunnanensis TaxID=58107 RepID=A0ABW4EVA9_9PSEU
MTANRLGLLIGAVFGTIYVVVNASALGAPVGTLLQVVGVAALVGLLVFMFRSRPAPGAAAGNAVGFSRWYWAVVAAEVVAFFAGTAVLRGPLDLPLAVLPWVTFVVGVHFLGLAKVWSAPSLLWLGAGLAACGLLGLLVAVTGAGEAVVAVVAGVAPGLILLGGSWWGAIRGGREKAAAAE